MRIIAFITYSADIRHILGKNRQPQAPKKNEVSLVRSSAAEAIFCR